MIKIDLITGFLGSGKTTFIREYAKNLADNNEKVCIIENDYGAINVDVLLLNELSKYNIGLETVSGGSDKATHLRRFRTKLITIAMLGYSRVIVEPSGIFDVDEFYDLLHEDTLSKMYEINNVLCVVRGDIEKDISLESKYLLASQISTAGKIVVSHPDKINIDDLISFLNETLEMISCGRVITSDDLFVQNLLDIKEFSPVNNSGLKEYGFVKKYSQFDNNFESLFFMNPDKDILGNIDDLLNDENVGNIIRIKGIINTGDKYLSLNITKNDKDIVECAESQTVIIVIGENLNSELISAYIPSEYSTFQVYRDAKEACE
ncbi:MAG: GTP-binding protein [Erysipelotrichaceae bacterium]|nr:GTP-binding protein [Erysipelotrichaceae bacterium]